MSDMTQWLLIMFLVSVAGSVFALVWPNLVARFRSGPRNRYRIPGGGLVGWLLVVVLIGAVLAALGFAAFLNDKETRDELKALGFLGYFSAFTYGFSTGALVEEPLKKQV